MSFLHLFLAGASPALPASPTLPALPAPPLLGAGRAAVDSNPWASLDAALAQASAQAAPPGVAVGALVRSSFDFSGDDVFAVETAGVPDDLQGLRFEDARLWAKGQAGPLSWRFSTEFADANGIPKFDAGGLPDNANTDGLKAAPVLHDAYGKWAINEHLSLAWGQFVAPVVRSSTVPINNVLFVDRSKLGGLFTDWEPGVMVQGTAGKLRWDVAAQNGEDDVQDDFALSARAELDIGAGAGKHEGAFGASEEFGAIVGIGFYDESDDTVDGSAIVVDGVVNSGAFAAFAEVGSFDEELAVAGLPDTPGFIATDDTTPWAIGGGYMLEPETWEIGARYQDFDDDRGASIVTLGANYYLAGTAAKWQFDVSRYEDDDEDGTLVQIGLTLGSMYQ
jgi:hypothetical protein